MLESFLTWVSKSDNWIVGVLSVLGAAIAHLKEFESKTVHQSTAWHMRGFCIKLIYAVFASLLTGQAATYYGLGPQLTFIAIGLCSAFAKEAIDLVWRAVLYIVKRRIVSSSNTGDS